MQKKIQLLKWALPLFTLLIIGGTAFGGTLIPTHADSNPPPGSCELAWVDPSGAGDGGGGNVDLDASGVTDLGLQETLANYNLLCADDVVASICRLIPGPNNSGNTVLDLSNIESASPWIYDHLNGLYGLNCDSDSA